MQSSLGVLLLLIQAAFPLGREYKTRAMQPVITSTGTSTALLGSDEMGWESPALALLRGDAWRGREKQGCTASTAFLTQPVCKCHNAEPKPPLFPSASIPLNICPQERRSHRMFKLCNKELEGNRCRRFNTEQKISSAKRAEGWGEEH